MRLSTNNWKTEIKEAIENLKNENFDKKQINVIFGIFNRHFLYGYNNLINRYNQLENKIEVLRDEYDNLQDNLITSKNGYVNNLLDDINELLEKDGEE